MEFLVTLIEIYNLVIELWLEIARIVLAAKRCCLQDVVLLDCLSELVYLIAVEGGDFGLAFSDEVMEVLGILTEDTNETRIFIILRQSVHVKRAVVAMEGPVAGFTLDCGSFAKASIA